MSDYDSGPDLPLPYAPPAPSPSPPISNYFSKAKKRPHRPSPLTAWDAQTNQDSGPSVIHVGAIQQQQQFLHQHDMSNHYPSHIQTSNLPSTFRSRSNSVSAKESNHRAISPDSPAYRSAKPRRRKRDQLNPNSVILSRWGFNWQSVLRALLIIAFLVYFIFKYVYELQVELAAYSRPWVRREINTLDPPLKGCFNKQLLEQTPEYNWTDIQLQPNYINFQTTISLRHQTDCFDFASTVPSSHPAVPLKHLYYHTYWRADLLDFTQRQAWTIKSFLATQPLSHSHIILWSNADLTANPLIYSLLSQYKHNFSFRIVDLPMLAKGTSLDGSKLFGENGKPIQDRRAWVDGDLVRLLVLWNYGGIWVDMDEIFIRDVHPLTESEWVTQWDCYDKPYLSLNGALMHFKERSAYLCEFFHLMSLSPIPEPSTVQWGSLLYLKLHRRLLAAGIPPFKVLPWCFADPRNCRSDIRFPDPFEPNPSWWGGKKWSKGGEEELIKRLSKDHGIFTLHLHNQWSRDFPPDGWVMKWLLMPYERELSRNKGKQEDALLKAEIAKEAEMERERERERAIRIAQHGETIDLVDDDEVE